MLGPIHDFLLITSTIQKTVWQSVKGKLVKNQFAIVAVKTKKALFILVQENFRKEY